MLGPKQKPVEMLLNNAKPPSPDDPRHLPNRKLFKLFVQKAAMVGRSRTVPYVYKCLVQL